MNSTNKPECCAICENALEWGDFNDNCYHFCHKPDMKQDTVWERDFDAGHNHMNISDPASDTEWVKNFIRTHFLPRTEVLRVIEELEFDIDCEHYNGADVVDISRLKDRLGI